MEKWIAYYLLVVNLLTFFIYGIDKLLAKMQKWRIPERFLIGLALLGGSIGGFLGMKCFHHKTRKAKFYIGVPVILLLQCALIIYIKFFA